MGPTFADIDGDGDLEILVPGSRVGSPAVTALDPETGAESWSFGPTMIIDDSPGDTAAASAAGS